MIEVKLTSIMVNDQDRARAFYTEKLGFKIGIPLTQLYTADIAKEHAVLSARGVVFKGTPQAMGPTQFADFEDTCGNIIRLVQG